MKILDKSLKFLKITKPFREDCIKLVSFKYVYFHFLGLDINLRFEIEINEYETEVKLWMIFKLQRQV